MATIAENLQSLVTCKNDIATAITNKGVILPENAGFVNFASAIDSIETGADSTVYNGEVSTYTYKSTLSNGKSILYDKIITIKADVSLNSPYYKYGSSFDVCVSFTGLPYSLDGTPYQFLSENHKSTSTWYQGNSSGTLTTTFTRSLSLYSNRIVLSITATTNQSNAWCGAISVDDIILLSDIQL